MPKNTDDKVHIGFRIDAEIVNAIQKIADEKYEGVFSMAIRQVILAGLKNLKDR
jgi:hypothetical protein